MPEKFEEIPEWRKDHFIEAYKFSSGYFTSFANLLFIINAGAIVGIISFLGNVLTRSGLDGTTSLKFFSLAIICFGSGIIFCAGGASLAYFVQRKYIVDLVKGFSTNDYEAVVNMFKLATRSFRIGKRQFSYSLVYFVLGSYGISFVSFLAGSGSGIAGLWNLK